MSIKKFILRDILRLIEIPKALRIQQEVPPNTNTMLLLASSSEFVSILFILPPILFFPADVETVETSDCIFVMATPCLFFLKS
jgi:hypothetical protein